jgi:hypothetical protein
MRILILFLFVVVSLSCPVLAQERSGLTHTLLSPYSIAPQTKTDIVWSIVKPIGFIATELDAISTTNAIKRGYVEANPLFNLIIPRNQPALSSRSLLMHGQTYAINMGFQYAYNKCGPSRFCKWTMIGARTFFTGMSITAALHNNNNR